MLKKSISVFLFIWVILCFPTLIVEIKPTESPKVAVKAQIAKKPRVTHKVVKYPIPSKKIAEIANKYEVSEEIMHKVIACESTYNPNAVGDGGKSYGLVQIHLPSHPNITKEQALDPDFAIEFLGKELSKGNGKIWTCYRSLKIV